MSYPIKLDTLTQSQRNDISKALIVRQKLTPQQERFNMKPKIHKTYTYVKDNVLLPMKYVTSTLKRDCIFNKPKIKNKFKGNLRDDQKKVVKECISHLNKHKTSVISANVGMGKTVIGIYLSIYSKLKTIVLTHRVILLNQWKEEIENFTTSKVQIVETNTKIDKNSQFLLMNAANVPKRKYSEFIDIGMCIVDELHTICTASLSKSLYYISPKYLIGLSATPYRDDGMDGIINVYFGEHRIHRELKRKHKVYQLFTNFKPEVENMTNGTINWNSILNSQAKSEVRNKFIVNIILKYPELNFLVIVKRVSQGEELMRLLKDHNPTSLLRNQDTFNKKSRILIATSQKVSAGFSHKKLNALMLCTDIVQYFIQLLGRVFRTREVEPIVFDIIDDHPILKRHACSREKVYLDVGGKIKSRNVKLELK